MKVGERSIRITFPYQFFFVIDPDGTHPLIGKFLLIQPRYTRVQHDHQFSYGNPLSKVRIRWDEMLIEYIAIKASRLKPAKYAQILGIYKIRNLVCRDAMGTGACVAYRRRFRKHTPLNTAQYARRTRYKNLWPGIYRLSPAKARYAHAHKRSSAYRRLLTNRY